MKLKKVNYVARFSILFIMWLVVSRYDGEELI